MTRKNNFDKSSTGTDIEVTCFYDTDSSRRDFEENFKVLQHSGYRTSSVLAFTGNGELPDISDIGFTVKGTREAKEKYLENWYGEDVKEWVESEMDSEIVARAEVNLIDYALDKLESIAGIEIVPVKPLICVSSTGYSQGDYSTIIYCPEDIEKLWGRLPEQKEMQTLFDHYLWDSPVYCVVTINGEEFNYWDMPEYDSYDFQRDKFIEYVAKESGIDTEQLESLVPEYPSYS
jgi:hypothetical protein